MTKFDRLISLHVIIPWCLYSCCHNSYAIQSCDSIVTSTIMIVLIVHKCCKSCGIAAEAWVLQLPFETMIIYKVTNWIPLSILRSCYKYRWCLLGIINYKYTVYCFSIHWYMETHHSLSQCSTQRASPHSPASHWPRRNYHHGNSKWEELHSADKHRGHCCPGNKPSYPRTTCACKLKYTSGALKDFSFMFIIVSTLNVCVCFALYTGLTQTGFGSTHIR